MWDDFKYFMGISIHALREEGDPWTPKKTYKVPISIHALREEGDRCFRSVGCHPYNFYPRPPRGGRHHGFASTSPMKCLFLSTPSARRATFAVAELAVFIVISIHALREEGDFVEMGISYNAQIISIHALREEGDVLCAANDGGRQYFYPRPPRGGRQDRQSAFLTTAIFLSTPSARRATGSPERVPDHRNISIHALREEGDSAGAVVPAFLLYFYPRPPRGGRRLIAKIGSLIISFLSTPSARRATDTSMGVYTLRAISIHALREEGDGKHLRLADGITVFLSTPSARRATYYNAMDTQSQTIFLSTPSARRATT